jgi:hypothetical protein
MKSKGLDESNDDEATANVVCFDSSCATALFAFIAEASIVKGNKNFLCFIFSFTSNLSNEMNVNCANHESYVMNVTYEHPKALEHHCWLLI